MKNLLLYISFIFSFFSSISQDFVFKSYVDQNNISTDDYIRFTVESSERVQLNNLNFKDFTIKQGTFTSSSSQTTIINGKFKSKNEFKSTFIIAPKNTGTLSIESIKVNYNGKDYQTNKITVNVSQKEEQTSEGIKKSLVEEISFSKEITEDQRKRLLVIAGKCPVVKMVKGETEIASSIQ